MSPACRNQRDTTSLPRTGWTGAADTQETVREIGAAVNVLDGTTATIWHTACNTSPTTGRPARESPNR